MVEKRLIESIKENPSCHESPTVADQVTLREYENLSFFLARTSETIHKTTVMIQQLESEVSRLKYEIMATENEYKNLRHASDDLEMKILKAASSRETGRSSDS